MAEHYHEIVQLRIELAETDPLVWRRVQVPADFRLRRLHDVIQAVFDWLDYHLHQFEVAGRLYGATEYDEGDLDGTRLYNDKNVKLGALLRRGIEGFVYRYDFGDDWEHVILVEKTFEPDPSVEYPILVGGARQAPPEDVGGPFGFADFLAAMADEGHPEHEELTAWYGEARFDPDDMQLNTVESMLSRIRASRRKGPAKGSRMPSNKVWRRIR